MAQVKRKPKSTAEPAVVSLDDRVAALEAEVAALKKQRAIDDSMAWVREMAGSFEGDADYLEAARLGAEYRRRQPKC